MQDTLRAMCDGRPVILLDDVDWENEADFIVAAERLIVPTMALLIRECSDIICLFLTRDAVDRLDLAPMVVQNESRFGTAFTVSIKARHYYCWKTYRPYPVGLKVCSVRTGITASGTIKV